ncbi:hypothetical protein BDZ91DRAFT_711700 [Kalaharituber pfeilii]|nr:hypothetical protein BDZ91DRAFT_711700 [Kalaharituber pfeilii]
MAKAGYHTTQLELGKSTTAITITVYAFCYSTESAYPKCQNYKQSGPSKGHNGFAEK